MYFTVRIRFLQTCMVFGPAAFPECKEYA